MTARLAIRKPVRHRIPLMKTYYLQEMLAWPNVKWPIVVTLMVLPPAINHSGCLQKLRAEKAIQDLDPMVPTYHHLLLAAMRAAPSLP